MNDMLMAMSHDGRIITIVTNHCAIFGNALHMQQSERESTFSFFLVFTL